MGDDIIDIFSGLPVEGTKSTRPSLPSPPRPRRPYKAYEVADEPQWNVSIHNPDLGIMQLSYAHLSKMLLTPVYYDRLDLFFHNIDLVVLLWGEHLDALCDPLQDRTLRKIFTFDENEYLKPKSEETLVKMIRRVSVKDYKARVAKIIQQQAQEGC